MIFSSFEFPPVWFQSQLQVRLPLTNSSLAGFLPILIFATVLLLTFRMLSIRTSSLMLKGMLLSAISLIISLAASLLVQDPTAAGAFWLSIALAVPGMIAVVLGVRTNPGRDTILLLAAGLLLVLFSVYADLSIWIATNLALATCEPYPGTITCQLPDFSYLIALTLLWAIPGVLAVINSSVYLQKTRMEKARLLEMRRKAAEKEQAKQDVTTRDSKPS